MEVYLMIVAGEGLGSKYPLSPGEHVIGRGSSATIRIFDPKASNRHCKIFVEEARVVVSDLKSRNGTFVNGMAQPMKEIAPGDRIVVGTTVFELRKGHV